MEDLEEALKSLRQAEQIYEYKYGIVDKKTCRVKRNVALLLLKANRYGEALEELVEVEELEKTLYGEQSVQLGKTYKVIGTLYIISGKPGEAREYLMRASRIFEAKGQLKLKAEIRSKLQMLSSSVNMAGAEIAAEERDEGAESLDEEASRQSPQRPFAGGGPMFAAKKGKKKPVKKGIKKGKKGGEPAFRNNFMREGAETNEGREEGRENAGADEEAFEMR